jgi:hypothetical protein
MTATTTAGLRSPAMREHFETHGWLRVRNGFGAGLDYIRMFGEDVVAKVRCAV